MKSTRFLQSACLLSLSTLVWAQSHEHKTADKPVSSEAQESFATIKTFAGEWEGKVTVPGAPAMSGATMRLSMRVTSRGNVVVHEFQEANTLLDPAKYDHPVTMLYVDGDQLHLIHYCDAGNRPHMTGKPSADGKSVEFTLVDVSGSKKTGYMAHAVFTHIDADHHTEDWTYNLPGDKAMHAHFDLHRVK